MIVVLLFLTAGIISGYFLKDHTNIIKISDKLLSWSIYLLLFLLGISVGSNQEIISNFDKIGFQAIILSIAGVIGSIVIAFFVYKFFFLPKNEK
ncbi:MAG: hypothetical protein B1H06_03125 [Candidatus Cloacimonas sp. 4484_143]|nr:MAG: hypothetical protein B1H06_03125 [Candidatus Cloacimonas sp. 4484_143]RLC52263.1 MAG: DUF340 domain-containing protein [Candidatus Cloacimonadota bacterium]RLC54251.1 MAG: DUF340 domain-containing protein [Candidatus Cloacimonadota bacterium]